MKTLVSVVIPCYNAEPWVGKAIQSCLDQTHQPMEIIVVDDGSTDQSKQSVLTAARNTHVSVRLIECSHKGASAARNQGLAAATGEYVQFLDADDLMSPRKIELQAGMADLRHDLVLCGPWIWLRQSNGHLEAEPQGEHMNCAGDLVQQWLEGNFFAVHCLLWPRKILLELGGWDETLSACQDGDLFMRAVLKGVEIRFVPESLVYYRTGHTRVSLSTRRDVVSLKSRIRVLDKIQAALESRGDLQEYRSVLAQRHYALARAYAVALPEEAPECLRRFEQLSPDGRLPVGLPDYLATKLLGLVRKEQLSHKCKALLRETIAPKPIRQEQDMTRQL